jgi:hypothetical protein
MNERRAMQELDAGCCRVGDCRILTAAGLSHGQAKSWPYAGSLGEYGMAQSRREPRRTGTAFGP